MVDLETINEKLNTLLTAQDILNEVSNVKDISGKVFPGLSSKENMTIVIQKIVKPLKWNKRVFWHTSRHSFAGLLFHNGVDIYTIKELMNHKEIETTLMYVKMFSEKKKNAIDKLPALKVG